jgi:outer membrane receptor protein involved in Fe transport
VLVTVGVSHDSFQDGTVSEELWNPKLGVIWKVADPLRVRAAAFKHLTRPLVADQTIEPTQVAGFNQLFDEASGMRSENLAAGLDLRFGPRAFLSFEGMHRDLRFDSGQLLSAAAPEQRQSEWLATGSFRWIASKRMVLSLAAGYDYFEWREPSVPTPDPIELSTYTFPLRLAFYATSWLSAAVTATYVDQEVKRLPSSPWQAGHETFTTVDLRFDLHLPKRQGLISLEVRNLFDETFRFQDDNFRSPETRLAPFLPELSVGARVSLFF